jgi:chromosome partitioning protein
MAEYIDYMADYTKKSLPKTIATINFKGGVGKTTMTWCLGDYLSTYKDNKNILIFDLDAQMSLTDAIAQNENALKYPGFTRWEATSRSKEKTILDAFSKYIEDWGYEFNFNIDYDFIYKISANYHFVPCHEKFYLLDFKLKNFDRKEMQGFMRDLLEKITSSENVITYDYVLFDCPPSFTLLSHSVLACCDLILIPFNPDFYAARGINILLQTLQWLNQQIESFDIPKVAVFMNKAKISRRGMEKESKNYLYDVKEICQRMEESMNIRCFDSSICDRTDIKRAVTPGKRGIPKEYVPYFQDLWNNIEEFIDE